MPGKDHLVHRIPFYGGGSTYQAVRNAPYRRDTTKPREAAPNACLPSQAEMVPVPGEVSEKRWLCTLADVSEAGLFTLFETQPLQLSELRTADGSPWDKAVVPWAGCDQRTRQHPPSESPSGCLDPSCSTATPGQHQLQDPGQQQLHEDAHRSSSGNGQKGPTRTDLYTGLYTALSFNMHGENIVNNYYGNTTVLRDLISRGFFNGKEVHIHGKNVNITINIRC